MARGGSLGRFALRCAAGLAIACHSPRATTAPEAPTPYDAWRYREGAPHPDAKVFLVAGGDDVANFAAEVLEQRRLWLQAGVHADEIACYFAAPGRRAYRRDRKQYDAILAGVRDCFRAEPATVLAHLHEAAQRDPPWLYLFVSAHGLGSLARWHADTDDRSIAAKRLGLDRRMLAALDQHAIGLQAGPGPRLEQVDAIVTGLREGRPARELVFTPGTLAEALAPLPAGTPKLVVLQACFSGGFIERPSAQGGASALAKIPTMTILTATTWDRPSFGCESGRARTYFGGAFNRVLATELEPGRRPPDLDWPRIHDRVSFVIDVMEAIDGERPSGPAFVQTLSP